VAVFRMTADQPKSDEDARGGRQEVLPSEEVSLNITLATGNNHGTLLDVSYHADFDPYERPLRLEHLFVPWAPALTPPTTDDVDETVTSVVDGDPIKGRDIFFGDVAKCSVCHTYAGKGGQVAADLTVSVQRSSEAVLRDIVEPSAAINPDYVSYVIETAEGKTLAGLLRSADEKQLTLIDVNAKEHRIERSDIVDLRASAVSLMPTGFDKLGKDDLENLVAFLCSEDAVAKQQGLPTGVIQREYWLDVPTDRCPRSQSSPIFRINPPAMAC